MCLRRAGVIGAELADVAAGQVGQGILGQARCGLVGLGNYWLVVLSLSGGGER